MSAPNHRESLARGLTLVRQFVPEATAIRLARDDGLGPEGFLLTDVIVATTVLLSTADPHLLDALIDDTWPYFRHLPWNGEIGEDHDGIAHITLPTTPLPDKTVWNCLTCGFHSDALRADRDAEHLTDDGAHDPNWHTDEEMGFTHD